MGSEFDVLLVYPDISSGLFAPVSGSIHLAACPAIQRISLLSHVQITSGIPRALNPIVVHGSDPLRSRVIFGILMTVNPHYRRRNGPRTVKRPNAIGQAITVNRATDNPSRPRPVHPLPLHQVGLVALAEAERGGEVAGEHVDLLDVGNQRLVDGLLVSRAAARDLLLLFFLSAPKFTHMYP